ncbi:helix-turn-helix domain-containing protein [Streptomyces sp. CA2R106]|uniref:helix-turn-helix domain-containing protein n=1 Tax=Streptomyces sp. CA2R106 TaxID=3120153 RepID=UPI00300B6FAB
MSDAAEPGETNEFATLLLELKNRSGLSYGALAKRLHMSTSTLHRYCNGTAIPTEYAPVERLARACRATPQELVELHRRWVLADAIRRAKAAQPGPPPPPAPSAPIPAPEHPGPDSPEGSDTPDDSDRPTTGTTTAPPDQPGEPAHLAAPTAPDEPVVSSLPSSPTSPRRRRTALIASAAAAVILATATLVTHPWSGNDHDSRDQQAVGATANSTANDAAPPSPTSSPTSPHRTPTSSPSTNGSGATGTPHPSSTPTTTAPPDTLGNATPVTVGVRPYVYDSPCSQHFLVDSEPAQVGPPAGEQDATRWAAAYGAVSSDEQRVALTVQGTGSETVVLEALHVRALTKSAPLAWNDYSMGVGCGGGVDSKSFDIDLDNGSPTVTVKNGQRDFPYKVSESDPEVFYVTAHTKAHDVRWDLTLDWSSGSHHGTVHIDNNGSPFRTSADVDRPGYDYPLGSSDWITRDS